MACEYCRGDGGHHSRCPNYNPPTSKHVCVECGEKILVGDEYIVNDNGNYAHWDCFYSLRDLLEFLKYKVEIMEDERY